MKNDGVKRLSSLAMFLALATLLNYVENLLPVLIPLPGIKLGLANTMNIIVLYFFGKKEYFSIGFLRVLLISVMFNGLFTNGFWLSFSGFLLSAIVVMLLSNIKNLSVYSLSISSAVFHSIGQICCAIVLYATPTDIPFNLILYLPILVLCSVITGFIISCIASLSIKRLEKISLFK